MTAKDLYKYDDFFVFLKFVNKMWNVSRFILLNDDPELKYYTKSKGKMNNIHDGQRKLCLFLLQFLTEFVHVKNAVVVYIGAAPGSNIIFNAELFPDITWHLYDSNPFDKRLYNMKNVTIYERYFTDEDAEHWENIQKKDGNIYFVSDIRVEAEKEENVARDMTMQMDWYKTIKPNSGSLKMRLPYITKEDIKVNYLDGFIFKQAWPPKGSTETRLVPFDGESMKEYSSLKYESQMFYHNNVIRNESYSFYDNEYTFDRMCEFMIIYNYIYKKLKNTRPTNEVIRRYSEYISTVIRKPTPF